MKILKKIIITFCIIIFIIMLMLVVLFIMHLNGITATITDINVGIPTISIAPKEFILDESLTFRVKTSQKNYWFTSYRVLFLDEHNKKIKASDLKKGDKIYILQSTLTQLDIISYPPEIQNVLLVKKLN